VEISQLIRQQREKLGMSQRVAADFVGCSQQALASWEAGRTKPRAEYHDSLRKTLKLTKKQLAS
jgi:DNA-binding XRE family transcriptional regulator